MIKEFQKLSYLKLDSSVVTSCTKTDGKWKVAIFLADMARNDDIPQWYYAAPESSPQLYYLARDYFQALRNIIAPAALMVRQQSSLIITPEWEYSS